MNTNTANNINIARRMANSWEKALHLSAEGYKFVTCTTADSPVTLIAIYKPTDASSAPSYWFRKGFTAPEMTNGCTCPDFTRHGDFCKHSLAIEDMENQAAAIEKWERMHEDAECANGVDYLL